MHSLDIMALYFLVGCLLVAGLPGTLFDPKLFAEDEAESEFEAWAWIGFFFFGVIVWPLYLLLWTAERGCR